MERGKLNFPVTRIIYVVRKKITILLNDQLKKSFERPSCFTDQSCI